MSDRPEAWTTEPPTEPGWYWHLIVKDRCAFPIEVDSYKGGLIAYNTGGPHFKVDEIGDDLWGPRLIHPPIP